MKILHYVDENRLAWMAPWIQLLKELERRGADNVVICRKGGTLSEELTKAEIKHFCYDPPAQWMPALAFGLSKYIDEIKPDLIHTRLSSAAALGGFWGQKKWIPVLSTFDKYPKARYYKNSDVLIGCSSAVTAYIETLNLPRASITTTILNPVLAERYQRDEALRVEQRKKMNVADDEVVVLGMGRFVAWKAWDDYLRAVAMLPQNSKFRFWLVGGGEEERSLRTLAHELGLENKIEFFPYAADVRPWLWASDVFVQTSKEPEGFSLMLLEAMSSGLAPIATNIGGTTDILCDGENGIMIPPCNVNSLCDAILKLGDSDLRKRLSKKASESAAKINVAEIAAQTIDLYKNTLLYFTKVREKDVSMCKH